MQQSSILTIARNFVLPLVAVAVLAGCGGGGSSAGLYRTPRIQNNPAPTSTPAPGMVLATAQLNGAPGFINSASHTVYVFDADLASPGQSVCNGACAQNWPPVAAPSGNLPANWSAIRRADGSSQLAYKGRPLYTFIADAQPGQANGDGINAFGVIWHIARP
jgi:predicted lipoprotein with Yx(FWY)xxD motif